MSKHECILERRQRDERRKEEEERRRLLEEEEDRLDEDYVCDSFSDCNSSFESETLDSFSDCNSSIESFSFDSFNATKQDRINAGLHACNQTHVRTCVVVAYVVRYKEPPESDWNVIARELHKEIGMDTGIR